MSKKDKSIGYMLDLEPRPLKRYRLRFETLGELKEILKESKEDEGCIRFSAPARKNLLGRIICFSRERLTIDVDAAEHIE